MTGRAGEVFLLQEQFLVSVAVLLLLALTLLLVVVLMGREIRRLRRNENVLRVSEQSLALALEVSGAGIWRWNRDQDTVCFDVGFHSMLGYVMGDLPTRMTSEWVEYHHPDDCREMIARVEAYLKGEIGFYESTHRIRCKNGEWAWVFTRGQLIKHADGPGDFMGIAMNITDRVKGREEKARLQEQLNQSQKLQSLGILAGGVAHDFNNLLAILYVNLELMSSGYDESRQCLADCLHTMDRARAITGQLLTFSKGGAPVKKTAQLGPFVRESVNFALSGSNTVAHFDIPEDLWTLDYDENQMGQVIDNLVINARQAMPEGGRLDIAIRNLVLEGNHNMTLVPGDYLKITFTDSGTGMPPEVQARVFDPYFTTKPQGRGLGLASVYSIIAKHQGLIQVESAPGQGTTFTILLPSSRNEPVVEPSAKPPAVGRGSGKVLVMDDEDDLRLVLMKTLTSIGYDSVGARNGEEVVAFLAGEKEAYTAILLDLTIRGGMGGLGTLKEIRHIAPDLPVYVFSGYSDDPVIMDPQKYGFTGGIHKPFRSEELSELLGKREL